MHFRFTLTVITAGIILGIAVWMRLSVEGTLPGAEPGEPSRTGPAAPATRLPAAAPSQGDVLYEVAQGPPVDVPASLDIVHAHFYSHPEPDINRQLETIAAFGTADNADAVLLLRGMLDNPSPSVREEAVASLAAIGGADAIMGLGYALSDDSKMVRQLAVELLAETGSDEAIGALALVLNDADTRLRKLAVTEIAAIRTHQASMMLQRFLSDENAQIRELAAAALQNVQEAQYAYR